MNPMRSNNKNFYNIRVKLNLYIEFYLTQTKEVEINLLSQICLFDKLIIYYERAKILITIIFIAVNY